MTMTLLQKQTFRNHFLSILNNLSNNNWQKTWEQLTLADENLPLDFEDALKYFVFLLKIVCLHQLGKLDEAKELFFDQYGRLKYASLPGYESPFLLFEMHRIQIVRTHRWLGIDFYSEFPELSKKFDMLFSQTRRVMNLHWKKLDDLDKHYFQNINSGSLMIPTYEELVLAADDAYRRETTHAKSIIRDCSYQLPEGIEITLMKQGWELILTARCALAYKPDQYFGKAFLNRSKKTLIIAHKGTDAANYNDLKTDFELLKRRLPKEYINQANSFLIEIKKYMTNNKLDDF